MLLDKFTAHSFLFQVTYEPAFEIWDVAGRVARGLQSVWGDLRLNDAKPQQQSLTGRNILLSTGIESSTVKLLRERCRATALVGPLEQTFKIWRDALQLGELKRVSARSLYFLDMHDVGAANKFVRDLGLVRIPNSRVFDLDPTAPQSGIDVSLRFQEKETFAVVRVRAEEVTFRADLDEDFVEEPIKAQKCRVVLDFDRGTLGVVKADRFRVEEWYKGYQHLLRRDVAKVLGG